MRGSQVVFGNDALRPQGCRRKSTGKRKARREQSRQAAGWGRCRFCGGGHGVTGRGKDAGIMPVWAPSGINTGFAAKRGKHWARHQVG